MNGWSLAAALCLTALVTATAGAAAFPIAKEGRAQCVIVVPPDAHPAERTAATELQEHLRLVTGATFQITSESPASHPAILVGPGAEAKRLLPDVNWDSLGHDGIVLKTVADNRLILAGGRPRGTLYAVYEFLERHVGVRWWTDSEGFIPSKPTLAAEGVDTVYVPKLRYRETFHSHVIGANHAAAARFRVNGHFSRIPPEWGGHYDILGWCHTAYHLLPPEKHFAEHPEWYSFRNGKRDPNRGQLCWTNPEVQRELAKHALRWIRKKPDAGIISVSQNDWHGACECETCAPIDKANGSQAASLITGVNAVAELIAQEYPDFLVETLAYQYTRKPPAHVKPNERVLVRLCSIEGNFAHPLLAEQNQSFGDDLRGWAAVAHQLFIWNYTTNFSSYLIPQPNLGATGDDLRFVVENKVLGVFEQADSFNRLAGDMLPLRAWLQAKLMWDPERDQQRLITEFLDGYYGPAGAYLGEYLTVVNAASKDPKFRRGCYHTDVGFLTPDDVARCNALFDRAEQTVAHDEMLLKRVRRERLALEHVNLLQFNFAKAVADRVARGDGEEAAGAAVAAEYERRAEAFCTAATDASVVNFSEAMAFSAYQPSLLLRHERFIAPRLPQGGEPLPAGAIDLQEHHFSLYRIGDLVEVVADPEASNGKAARMPGRHTEWAVQVKLTDDGAQFGKGPWKCYIVARVEPKASAGPALQYGAYDWENQRPLAHEAVDVSQAGDGKYRAYGLRFDALKPGMYFWVSPPGGASAGAVYVDRVYIVKDAAK